MNHHFKDIRDRIPDPPTWWDMNGTPRWGEFSHASCSNIYAREVALLEIQCQHCRQPFRVEIHSDFQTMHEAKTATPLAKAIENKTVHYGDPPYHDDPRDQLSCIGNSMNVYDVRVMEYWSVAADPASSKWVRNASLEIVLETPEDMEP